MRDNSGKANTILDLSVSSNDRFEGYFFMIIKEKDINQSFAIKRIKANRGDISVKFTSDDFMLGEEIEVPNEFELVIKHSKLDRFSSDSKLVEVFKMNIDNYNVVRQEKLKITF